MRVRGTACGADPGREEHAQHKAPRGRLRCCQAWLSADNYGSVFDVALFLAAALLRIALFLAALGVILLVCGAAVDLVRARLVFGALVGVPALLALLRLVGGECFSRDGEESDCGQQCACAAPESSL
jgi:hypothetical protein